MPELPGAIAAYMESIEGDEEAKGEEIAEFIASNIFMLASPNKVKILTQLEKTKKLGKALRIVAEKGKVGKSKSLNKARKVVEKKLPTLDATGKVHGTLPKVKDLSRYSKDELQVLLKELKRSIQRRIEITSKMGSDRAHGQRQGTEQDLIKAIENHLQCK